MFGIRVFFGRGSQLPRCLTLHFQKSMSRPIPHIALDAAAATQASGTLPGWFVPNAGRQEKRLKNHVRFTFSIFRAWELEPNQRWEVQPNGDKLLITDDPQKGRMIAISVDRPDSERMELFRIDVDRQTMEATVLMSTELSQLDMSGIHLSTTVEYPWPPEPIPGQAEPGAAQ